MPAEMRPTKRNFWNSGVIVFLNSLITSFDVNGHAKKQLLFHIPLMVIKSDTIKRLRVRLLNIFSR